MIPHLVPLPEGFTHLFVRKELHERIPVLVTRYQRTPDLVYGIEHVTTVVGAEDDRLYGYTRHVATADDSRLPSPEEARRIAFDVLERIDADHSAGLEVLWVRRHDERLADSAATVAGIKVKTVHPNGLYTWVIVGEGGQVITYERDVAWIGSESRRHTHMWLHDHWVAAHDAGGPEFDAPLARLTQS
ncbi:hypothetical protein [Cellulomonas sp. NPDC089187]|uniref:hypothetical protein n=1 Tax=Cellulomonas sp. NPDC089187 TaxID=3154970 RepID=UPI00343499EC